MSAVGTFRPIECLEIRSADWGIPDQVRAGFQRELMSSRAEGFHLRVLPKPYVNLSIHTAPDVRPLP
jgi:hypothetical protein